MRFIAIILILLSFQAYSQTLEMVIMDEYDNLLFDCDIYINNHRQNNPKTHLNSIFLNVNSQDEIEIRHSLYEKELFSIPSSLRKNDTLQKRVVLKPKFQEYEEFSVIGEQFSTVYGERNKFIHDYYPLQKERQILLVEHNNEFFLKLIDSKTVLDSLPLQYPAKELFLDVFGNLFFIGRQKATQFNIVNNQIILHNESERKVFEEQLRNAVSVGENHIVFQNFSMHNQKYSLIKVEKGKGISIYSFFEIEKYKRAAHYYNQTVNYYMATISEKDNVILMGIWDGDLITLNLYDKTINRMTTWSDKITSKKLNIISFGIDDKIVVLNGETDSIVQIKNGDLTTSRGFSTKQELTGKYFYDFFCDELYMVEDSKGTTQVYNLEINTGETVLLADLKEIRKPTNIKVIDGKIYFLVFKENRFNLLMRAN